MATGPDLSVLSISQLALVSGKTRETVRKKLDGVIQPVNGGNAHSKKYSAPAAMAVLFNTGEGFDLTTERARHAAAQADQTELKNAVTRGEQIPRSEILPRFTMAIASLKSSVQGVPSRVRQQAPHMVAADVEMVRELLDNALHEFSDALLAICPEPDPEGGGSGSETPPEADPI